MNTDRVLIVGAGGLGVPAALSSARHGVRRIGIIDPDPVELSNLARQVIYRDRDIGAPKVAAMARKLRESFADVEVETYAFALDAGNAASIIGNFGFVIDAT
ncbi:MAG: HesA/MoeB/ThiF family protein, partial [Candidatus Binataceae bacterium]